METKKYKDLVLKTESKDFDAISSRLKDKRALRLLHGSCGIATEAGELLDTMKKHIFYGKEIDTVNIVEEIGDLMWYSAILLDELGVEFEEVMEKNINKLKARYGDKFTETGANVRDLNKERKILES
ncbi:MAG TPA: nucleoside triphosphate pyrophosphohydrolase family protein [bacterium]|nr:nucleoside triphosphate pyrophosphohydrolase family protein [bacterium]